MRIRFMKSIHKNLGFLILVIVGGLICAEWVISNRSLKNRPSQGKRRALEREIKDEETNVKRNRPEVKKDDSIKNTLLAGHTLKPLEKKKGIAVAVDIPPVPEFSDDDVYVKLDHAIMEQFLKYTERPATHTVLILTPIHNSARHLRTYLKLLQSLTYPHRLISVALGEDSSHDNTLHVAESISAELRKSFAEVDVFHFNLSGQLNDTSWSTIHSKQNQFVRRRHLAQARNALLKAALKKQDWVLWIDSDVFFFASDIIQQLLSAEKEIVVPLCAFRDGKRLRVFDKNTWRETNASLAAQQHLLPNQLVLEGYDKTKRLWLSDLRAEGRVVPIDGVGGCMLLVQASCHRKGLSFPVDLYENHIETEGMAKMAKRMGFEVNGMPFVEVFH